MERSEAGRLGAPTLAHKSLVSSSIGATDTKILQPVERAVHQVNRLLAPLDHRNDKVATIVVDDITLSESRLLYQVRNGEAYRVAVASAENVIHGGFFRASRSKYLR